MIKNRSRRANKNCRDARTVFGDNVPQAESIVLRLLGERREGGQGKRETPKITLPKLKFMEKALEP